MKKTDLPNCPKWLLDADTFNEDVTLCSCGCGMVIWTSGEFRGGAFLGGAFLGGEFRGGAFRGGAFLGGEFLGGEFRGGEFRGGAFRGGEFRGGASTCRSKYIPILRSDTKTIKIGCKNKTREKWDAWFDGTEVYETPRDSEAFRLIEGHYRALVVWAEFAGLLPKKESPAKEGSLTPQE